MKYILVTGGVISGIGKGVVASSVGVILKQVRKYNFKHLYNNFVFAREAFFLFELSTYIQIITKVFSLIKYFLSNKNVTSPILTLDAN